MHFEQICRICLEVGEMKSIFTTNCTRQLKISCAEAIINISSVSAKEDDGLPKNICKKCLNKLKVAYKFKILCEESYAKLTNGVLIKYELDLNADVKNNSSDEAEFPINDQSDFESNEKTEYSKASDGDKEDILERKSKKKKKLKRLNKNDESLSDNINYFCRVCSKSFANDATLKKHELTHLPTTPYFCDICQKTFRSELKHKELHSKDKQLQCEICAKVFLRAAALRMHLLAHRNELPFKCTYPDCGKSFPQNSRLQLHLKVHTNERNFICHYCSHAARDKQQLTVHIRYFHTKEKNFLCGDCGKAFVSPQARYYHAKRHQNIRNHHCPHCDKSFIFAFGLQEHLVTHTGEKRFACSLCDARFSRKAHKEKHESRLHGVNRTTGRKSQSIEIST